MFDKLVIHKSVGSTQDLARELAQQGEPEGAAVMALEQTSGRGRAGHSWISPPGKNLALSLLLRPTIDPTEAALLGMMASISAAETVEACGVRKAELKWPNDVWVNGRKIAGILPEAALTNRTVEYVILGIGLNVNSEETDFPPELRDTITSISLSSGRKHDLEQTARLFLQETAKLYTRVLHDGCGFIPALWETRWAHRNSFFTREGVRYKAESIAADGSLVALSECGELLRFTSGQVDVI
ncbi:MAG: biotin--[acetyl-CoA-carboxylase] ligase [Desulfomonile tiedjei]|uniref:Biotin--[acetyl-CoA-carboxylase] ligase n=1 Tax=Desulfomonile tiedjei TaxID=2358 RepID=A0A9D6Z5E5_9BACT|nr:biotin--[acetyl-CoA-carboxylase] ligase [Desulfomonile tiedjei]